MYVFLYLCLYLYLYVCVYVYVCMKLYGAESSFVKRVLNFSLFFFFSCNNRKRRFSLRTIHNSADASADGIDNRHYFNEFTI